MESSSNTRDLGVYLSDDCSWSLHINKTASAARHIASWILGAFRDRSVLTMVTLFKSLVRSKVLTRQSALESLKDYRHPDT